MERGNSALREGESECETRIGRGEPEQWDAGETRHAYFSAEITSDKNVRKTEDNQIEGWLVVGWNASLPARLYQLLAVTNCYYVQSPDQGHLSWILSLKNNWRGSYLLISDLKLHIIQ